MDWLRCQNLLLYSLKFYFRIWLLARSPLSPKKALFFNDMLQPNYFSLPKIMRFTKRSSPFISFMKLFIASLYFIMLIYIYIYIYICLKIHVWERTYEPVIILHLKGWGREWMIFLGGVIFLRFFSLVIYTYI